MPKSIYMKSQSTKGKTDPQTESRSVFWRLRCREQVMGKEESVNYLKWTCSWCGGGLCGICIWHNLSSCTLNCCVLMVFLNCTSPLLTFQKARWRDSEENVEVPQGQAWFHQFPLQFHGHPNMLLSPLCPSLPSTKRRWRCWGCAAKDWPHRTQT